MYNQTLINKLVSVFILFYTATNRELKNSIKIQIIAQKIKT